MKFLLIDGAKPCTIELAPRRQTVAAINNYGLIACTVCSIRVLMLTYSKDLGVANAEAVSCEPTRYPLNKQNCAEAQILLIVSEKFLLAKSEQAVP